MADKKRLIEILRKPIFPHELVDPTEAVADYLLDNDVVPVVRCKDCIHYRKDTFWCDMNSQDRGEYFNWYEDDFCSYGERKDNERKAD